MAIQIDKERCDGNLRVTTNIGDGEVYGWGFQHPVTGNAYATSTIGKDFSTNIIGKPWEIQF